MSKILVGMMAAAATTASAAEPPSDLAPSTTVSGIVVTAPAPREPAPPMRAVRSFVGSIGVMSTGEQLAIWNKIAVLGSSAQAIGTALTSASGATICPVVFGLPPAYAAFITARMRQVGAQVGAPVVRSDCRTSDVNVVIAFPVDTADFIHQLADEAPSEFGFKYHGMLVQDLKKPVKPIRAWYATQVISVVARASRLTPQRVSVIHNVLIIVDGKQTDALNMGQLSDYLAMTTLAEIKTGSIPAAAPSILNVFSDAAGGRASADGLTRLDLSYLKALYAIAPRQEGFLQNDQIADRVRRELAGP